MTNADTMTIRQYLDYVYPLASEDFCTQSDAEIQRFFDNLNFYYKLNPQSEAVLPTGKYIPRNTELMPEPGDLYSPAIINPEGFWCRNVYPSKNPLNNKVVNGFPSHSDIEIFHSNVYNGSVGIYYYLAQGSGIYVNVGNTLVVRNKLHALRLLGLSNSQIAAALNDPGTNYWPAYYEGVLPPNTSQACFYELVKQYMEKNNCSKEIAESDLIDSAINETNYEHGRVNDTGWQVDDENFKLGQQQGYDTIQLTSQANMNNGWAFEIIDLRVKSNTLLDETMSHLSGFCTIRNPLEMSQSMAIRNTWPYYNLYSEGTMSDIAKCYSTYSNRFVFPGPGQISYDRVPGYPQ